MAVFGRVVDVAGAPVGGAYVRVEPGPHTTTTAADGTFTFDLPARTYRVLARKDRWFASHVLVGEGHAHSPVTLPLQLGTTLVVNVLATGTLVAGATVTLEHGIRATTDGTGRAIAHGLGPGNYHGMVIADGYADVAIMVPIDDDPGGTFHQTVRLVPGARIEGVVLDRHGAPLADAAVRSQSRGAAPTHTWSRADGSWTMHLQPGTYEVFADTARTIVPSDGHTPQRGIVLRHRRRFDLRRRLQRLVRGEPATTIAGVVVDEHGRPAAGADVRVLRRTFLRADANGRFEVDGLEPGEYELRADWPWPSARDGYTQQRVRTGDRDIRLVLPARATITFRALLDGAPVPYVGVSLLRENELPHGGSVVGMRDDHGRFAVPHVRPGTWRIAVVAPGTRVAIAREVTVAGNETVDLGDIALIRGRRLAGHVRDAAGAPVVGARVVLGRMEHLFGDRSQLGRILASVHETTTDTAGAYLIDGIDPEQRPTVVAEIVRASHPVAGASIIHAAPTEDATLDFVLLGAGRIEGTVENLRAGYSLVSAIRADEPANARRVGCTMGRFVFEDVPRGEYTLQLDVPDAERVAPITVSVVANQTARPTFVLHSKSVRLCIHVPAGRGNNLVIEPTSEGAGIGGRVRSLMRLEGSHETCSFDWVRPGTYRVSLDGTHWTAITVVASTGEQTIDLRHLA